MRRTLFKVHNAVGVAACLFLSIIAITGVLLTFRGNFRPSNPKVTPGEHVLGIEALVAIATAEVGAPATDVEIPSKEGAPFVVWLDDEDASIVFMDGAGTIVERRSRKGGWLRVIFKLHTGEILGLPGQALSVLSGLSLLLLSLSGLGMVLARRRRKKD